MVDDRDAVGDAVVLGIPQRHVVVDLQEIELRPRRHVVDDLGDAGAVLGGALDTGVGEVDRHRIGGKLAGGLGRGEPLEAEVDDRHLHPGAVYAEVVVVDGPGDVDPLALHHLMGTVR